MRLIPTNQWVYDLFRVTYHESEGSPALVTVLMTSSNDGHLRSEIEERWPNPQCKWYQYERIAEDVGHPAIVGSYYGANIYESGTAHAETVAKRLKIGEAV